MQPLKKKHEKRKKSSNRTVWLKDPTARSVQSGLYLYSPQPFSRA